MFAKCRMNQLFEVTEWTYSKKGLEISEYMF